jgi:hypothetical protein
VYGESDADPSSGSTSDSGPDGAPAAAGAILQGNAAAVDSNASPAAEEEEVAPPTGAR